MSETVKKSRARFEKHVQRKQNPHKAEHGEEKIHVQKEKPDEQRARLLTNHTQRKRRHIKTKRHAKTLDEIKTRPQYV